MVIALVLVSSTAAHAERPNFLIITSEDMSPDLGAYGVINAITPNLDALARRGNHYTSAFANAPICSPARTALLFSRYQTSLGAGNHRSRANTPNDLLGFAKHLRDAGYFCTNHPKVDYNTPSAWDIERATYDRGQSWRAPARGDRPFLSIINIAVSHQSYTSVLPHEAYRTQVRARLQPHELHDPADVTVPPYFPDTPAVRKELARYADCVTLMDKRAGRILDQLETDGLAGDTIVIYFSDHGAGHPRHKSTPFATGLRVPFIVACPPKFERLLRAPKGEPTDDLVTFIDVGPTLLSLAGVDIPESMHGKPFLGPTATPRKLAFAALDRRAESHNLARTVTDGRFVYIRNYMPHIPIGQPKGYGFPSAIYQELNRMHEAGTLAEPAAAYLRPPPPEMLFDLECDPHEINNLATDPTHRDTLHRLRNAHTKHLRDISDLNFVPEEELAARAGNRPWSELAETLPLEDIYNAAALVGGGRDVLSQQLDLLEHPDSVVRWWAVIGLRNQPSDTPRVRRALNRMLSDPSATVRIEAAVSCLDHAYPSTDTARDVLLQGISGNDPRLAHRAARAAQLLGLRSTDFIQAIEAAAQRHQTEWLNEVVTAVTRP